MVTVATSVDAPIKILFPKSKYLFLDNSRGFALLGGGDIIVPGLWCGLCLRYDWCVPSSFFAVSFCSDPGCTCTSKGPALRSQRSTYSSHKDNTDYPHSTNHSSPPRSSRTYSGSARRSVRCIGSRPPNRLCCISGMSSYSPSLHLSLVRIIHLL